MPVFEPQVYWLDLVGVKADDLAGAPALPSRFAPPQSDSRTPLAAPVKDLVEVYKLAADEFVVEEGAQVSFFPLFLSSSLRPRPCSRLSPPAARSQSAVGPRCTCLLLARRVVDGRLRRSLPWVHVAVPLRRLAVRHEAHLDRASFSLLL